MQVLEIQSRGPLSRLHTILRSLSSLSPIRTLPESAQSQIASPRLQILLTHNEAFVATKMLPSNEPLSCSVVSIERIVSPGLPAAPGWNMIQFAAKSSQSFVKLHGFRFGDFIDKTAVYGLQ